MIKKKLLETEHSHTPPLALIIGGGQIGESIADILKDRGCGVLVENEFYKGTEKFDYIIHFSDFKKSFIYPKYLKLRGKYIFVETYDEGIKKTEGIKIIKIGDPNAWNILEISEKIITALFSESKTLFINSILKPLTYKVKEEEIPKQQVITKPETVSSPLPPTPVNKIKDSKIKKTEINYQPFIIIFLILFLITGIASFFSYLKIKSMELSFFSFKSHIASGNYKAASVDLSDMKKDIILAKEILTPFRAIPIVNNVADLLYSSENLIENGEDLANYSQSLNLGNSDFSGNLVGLKSKINILRQSIIESKSKLDKTDIPFFPKESYLTLLTSSYNKLTSISDLLPISEKLLLSTEGKIYMVLFQNNMELRPTGGFIGSYGLLTLGNGKVGKLNVFDVYSSDGQLKGHVDPPLPIRKYLDQPNFFLRDSNFDPDFTISGEKAAWFLEKETGVRVSGVIGVNLFLIDKILNVTGPVRLSDFGSEEINAENFYQKAHYYSENNFFPGSTQKKDFLTSVANNLMLKINDSDSGQLLELLPIIKKGFEEKNILLYSKEFEIQKIAQEKNLAGRVTPVRCQTDTSSCYPDYLLVSEANLGINKANYFVSKSLIVEKSIDEAGVLNTTLSLSYKNDSASDSKSPLTLSNYIRIFVPKDNNLKGITLNGAQLPLSNIDMESYPFDKISYGFMVKIAPNNKGVVKISLTAEKPITDDFKNYTLIYQKQSGDKLSPLVLSVINKTGNNFKPVNFTSTSSKENEIYYSTDTSVDRVFVLGR